LLSKKDSPEIDRLASMVQTLEGGGGLLVAVVDAAADAISLAAELSGRLGLAPPLIPVSATDLLVDASARTGQTAVMQVDANTSKTVLRGWNATRDLLVDECWLAVLVVTGREQARVRHEAPDFLAISSGEFQFGRARRLRHLLGPVQRTARAVRSQARIRQADLDRLLRPGRTRDEDYLLVLRQWNSFTPILSQRSPEPRGGGYYLNWRGTGVAIDPGHDFVHNLFGAGLGIADLNAVVLTHDHGDHTQDFESLLDLVYQFNCRADDRGDPPHRIGFYLNLSTFEKTARYFRGLPDTPVAEMLRPDKEVGIGPAPRLLRLQAAAAQHPELGNAHHAVSLRFTLRNQPAGPELVVAMTSDTGYHGGLAGLVAGAAVVVAHIGTVTEEEVRFGELYGKHLGLLGCFLLTDDVLGGAGKHAPLVVLSEFGEELLSSRRRLADLLADGAPAGSLNVVAADVGTRINLVTGGPCYLACQANTVTGEPCTQVARRTVRDQQDRLSQRCPGH